MHSRPSRIRPVPTSSRTLPRRLVASLVLGTAAMLIGGCASSGSGGGGGGEFYSQNDVSGGVSEENVASAPSAPTDDPAPVMSGAGDVMSSAGDAPAASYATDGLSAAASEVEARYVIGPAASRILGLRIDWQSPPAQDPLRFLSVQGDSVYTLDTRNRLGRIRAADGARAWPSVAMAKPVDRILSVTAVPRAERAYLMEVGSVIVVDTETGAQIGRQRLDKVAATAPVMVGPNLVYGALNGQLTWHNYMVGEYYRGYEISKSMRLTPVYGEQLIVAIGSDGQVIAVNGQTGRARWSKKLLDEVVAPPAIGSGAVYIAGRDQYLWCLDLMSGRKMWEYFTDSPLVDPPVVIGDRVYQQVASDGLVCLAALPLDKPGGEVIWTAEGVRGTVVTKAGYNLLAWDAASRTMTVLESGRGGVIETLRLPDVEHLISTGPDNGTIYAAGRNGRVVRLTPTR